MNPLVSKFNFTVKRYIFQINYSKKNLKKILVEKMSKEYILAHDMGTSGCITSLVRLGEKSEEIKIIESVLREYDVIYPGELCAEQDPHNWWATITQNVRDLVKKTGILPNEIAAIVHSTQMLGCMPVDKDGNPLMNCMIWMDARATTQCLQLWDIRTTWAILKNIRRVWNFLKITGGGPSPRDMISKIMWIKQVRPDLYEKTYKFLDVIDWLLLKSAGIYATPMDYASPTWLLDIQDPNNFHWSEKIAGYADIDLDKLNNLVKCTDVVGELTPKAAEELNLKPGIPIVAGCGDASSAMAGSGAVNENEVHLYVGSSSWFVAPVSRRLRKISMVIGSIVSPNPEIPYTLIAEQKNMGACYKWFRNAIGVNESYEDLDLLAAQAPPGSNKLIFTPWIYGESCPVMEPRLRGGYINLNIETTRADMIRAILEGVAFNARWAFEGIEELIRRNKGEIEEIRYIGGGAMSNLWSQIMADILNKKILQMENPIAAGTIGSSLVAGLAIDRMGSFREFKNKVKVKAVYTPNAANKKIYDTLYHAFRSTFKRLNGLYKDLNPAD